MIDPQLVLADKAIADSIKYEKTKLEESLKSLENCANELIRELKVHETMAIDIQKKIEQYDNLLDHFEGIVTNPKEN